MARRVVKTVGIAIVMLAAALWMLSYWTVVYRSDFGNGPVLWMSHGEFILHNHGSYTNTGWTIHEFRGIRTNWWPTEPGWWTSYTNLGVRSYRFCLPLWIPMAFGFALVLGVWVVPRRHRHDRCFKCGYDMTGLKLMCPECGWTGEETTTPHANETRGVAQERH